MYRSIRFKSLLGVLVFVVLVTAVYSLIILYGLDNFFLGELTKKGFALSGIDTNPSGFTIHSHSVKALNDIAHEIKNQRNDILYVITADKRWGIKVHGETKGNEILAAQGERDIISDEKNFSVKRVQSGNVDSYEFKAPLVFKERKVGDVYIGIDARNLQLSQTGARKFLILISGAALVVGIIGAYLFSNNITDPIKKLTAGVMQLKSGNFERDLEVGSGDELGQLTENFNEMAKGVMKQKQSLEMQARNLEETYLSTLRILIAAIDARDQYTLGHSTRVAKMSLLVGRKLGLNKGDLRNLQLACLFHDVGKVRVPDHILNKNTPFSHEENQLMMKHPEHGAEILRLADSLHRYIPAVLYHHEWYNGKGYPTGLKGERIPLFASIISITDAYDAMISTRPYRKGLSKDEAVKEILEHKGSQFNPRIADIFIEVLRSLWEEDTVRSDSES